MNVPTFYIDKKFYFRAVTLRLYRKNTRCFSGEFLQFPEFSEFPEISREKIPQTFKA